MLRICTRRFAILAGAAIVAGICLAGVSGCTKPQTEQQQTIEAESNTSQMVQLGAEKMEKILGYEQAVAIRNMLGGARAVYIAPDIRGGAAFLGLESGTGFLLRRHGKEWSDPAFMKLSEVSLGYQGGAKESHMVMLLMTDKAVDDFINGKIELGGKGGFAIGTYGLGATGAGGLKGGLELLIITTNEGVFLGGGVSEMSPTAVTKLNGDIYGAHSSVAEIVARPGGKYAPAIPVRKFLSEMVVKAWDVQP